MDLVLVQFRLNAESCANRLQGASFIAVRLRWFLGGIHPLSWRNGKGGRLCPRPRANSFHKLLFLDGLVMRIGCWGGLGGAETTGPQGWAGVYIFEVGRGSSRVGRLVLRPTRGLLGLP